jgi:4-alpha-glucanotransferase
MGVETTTMTRTTDAWGIDSGYFDISGNWFETRPDTRRILLEAMGVDPDDPEPPASCDIYVVRPGEPCSLQGPGSLVLEDGTELEIIAGLPPDLPLGYHEWRPEGGGAPARVIVSPGRCHLDEDQRRWAWAVQLYTLRSQASWGMGDLGDLRDLAIWSRGLGAGMLLVNPLNAALPTASQEASPYYPSSRRYHNPIYLRVEDAPGVERNAELETAIAEGRALNARERIDRDAVFRLKMGVLERAFARAGEQAGLDRFCADQGRALADFATFCALVEHHQSGWPSWPEEHRRPDSPAVRAFAAEHHSRVRFHQWLQWLCDEQLRRVGSEIGVMHDLPIGVDPCGADAWAWQDVLARGVRVGAPPDKFATQGQDWGLPPFIPHKLRAAGYDPFIQVIRSSLRHAGGLRIDHVMGLFRLFWIGQGQSPREGTYVRYPADDLLAILALESHRAQATIVGEDLGTVEDGVREKLHDHRVLSYRVVWFESERPVSYPKYAVAAVTTHDLPTIAGLWSGSDLEEQRQQGLSPNEQATHEIVDQVARLTGLPHDADPREVVLRVHRALGESPCVLIAATLEDAALMPERPNMPGAGGARGNWSIPLPLTLEELRQEPLAQQIAETLSRR